MNGVITPPYIKSYRLVTGPRTYIIYPYLVRFSVQLSISPLSDFQMLFRIYDFVGSLCSGGAIFLWGIIFHKTYTGSGTFKPIVFFFLVHVTGFECCYLARIVRWTLLSHGSNSNSFTATYSISPAVQLLSLSVSNKKMSMCRRYLSGMTVYSMQRNGAK